MTSFTYCVILNSLQFYILAECLCRVRRKKKHLLVADMSVNGGQTPCPQLFFQQQFFFSSLNEKKMQNVLKRKNMFFVKKSCYQKHFIKNFMFQTILDLLICKSDRYGNVRNLWFFLTPSLKESTKNTILTNFFVLQCYI